METVMANYSSYYDEEDLAYISDHAATIAKIARILGVSEKAVENL